MLGRPETKYEAIHRTQSDIYSTSTFRFSSAHYVTFMSYRVSLPFLKFAPTSFPSFPLPGIFTTVIVLLVMVWIAILTIGLVEFGNYLWNGTGSTRDAEHRGADGEQGGENEEHELLGPEEMLKSSPQAAGVPMAVAEDFSDEASPMLTSRSNSDAGSDIEEYHPSI